MKNSQKILLPILLLGSLLLLFSQKAVAADSDEDFVVDTKTEVQYNTGEDFATIKTEYIRTVKNSTYYFSPSGEKVFHIPDLSTNQEEEIQLERKYKLDSLTVKDSKGNSVKYSVEEKDSGEGIYITVPNYKSTTSTSPYHIIMQYNSHDYITKIGSFVNIVGTSLPKDTIFERKDEENGTVTVFNYYFTIVVDQDIAPLAKAFPKFTKTDERDKTHFEFKQTDRISNSPSLEFGTSVLYKFDLNYVTPKTDSLISEKYSSTFKALSTNIYELSLPREFSETNQQVYFEKVSPPPKDIYKDKEGNILALFEVPANQKSSINISGYISVKQEEYTEDWDSFDMRYDQYLEAVGKSEYVKRYLAATKYWQSNDDFIRQEAQALKENQETLLSLVQTNYQYINEKLEYDQQKATSENERIGAKEALLGGASVCMEYADVMISLLRAQGVPTRAAIGYANLRNTATANQVRHQWVQIWIPEYGWLSVDPTFESNNFKIGQMVDRVLWEVFNNDSLSNIRIYSANDIVDLTTEGFSIRIHGVEDEINLDELKTYTDLVAKGEIREATSPKVISLITTALKTTVLGKALLVSIPILILLTILISLISTISYLVRKKKGKKGKERKRPIGSI